jgi:hypothetical protein
MEIRIIVLSSGEASAGKSTGRSGRGSETLDTADAASDVVLYHRENPQVEPAPSVSDLARSLMDLVVARKLRISLSSQPDFSDYTDRFGQSHPRPEGTEPVSRGEFDPAMSDVDLRPKPEGVFAEARRMAGRVVMVGRIEG